MKDRSVIKVLIVEDQEAVRDTIRLGLRTIRQFKFEFVEASHGGEGMTCLISGLDPDLIIADLMMPEMDGFTFIKTVKQDKRYQNIPIIVLSAKSSGEDIAHALQLGAMDYLFKPFEYGDLFRIVRGIEIGVQLRKAERIETLEEQIQQQNFLWSTVTSLETSRIFKLQKIDDILPLCTLLSHYFPQEKKNILCIGLNEIALNAVIHGNLELSSSIKEQQGGFHKFEEIVKERENQYPYKDRAVTITLNRFEDYLQFVILDQGKGFDPSLLKDPTTDPECLILPYGRGIAMTKFAFDLVKFDFPQSGGTAASLIQYFEAKEWERLSIF